MNRSPYFDSPLLLGFEHTWSLAERAARGAAEGYPPFNIEDCGESRIRITLAVAGFTVDQLSVSVGENQLTVTGKREPDGADAARAFIHRGIAARGFSRAFVLADGLDVTSARLEDGLLHIVAERPEPRSPTRQVPIETAG
jgi:HSP20 family molecular chaperone IbpA